MNIRKILVIKLRHLGDVLLSSPVFTSLKRFYPESQIDAYVWKEAAPILEGHPSIRKIYTYDRELKKSTFVQRFFQELKLLRCFRSEKYDLVINLTEGERGAHVALFSGAHTKVGFIPKKKHIAKIFTHLVHSCKTPKHAVERDLDTLRILGIHPIPKDRELIFSISKEDEAKISKLVPKGPYVVIHPVARWKFKCPPSKLISQVIDGLEIPVVLTGDSSEILHNKQIEKQAKRSVINLTGKISLKELGALLKGAKGVITVDSMSLHMASAFKIPTVAIFGPTSEASWGPWRNLRSVVISENRACRPCLMAGCGNSKLSDCLYTLSPDAIVKAFQEVTSEAVIGEGAFSTSSLLALNSLEI